MRGVGGELPRTLLTETPLAVRFADVDMMQTVHHSVYLHWFEQVRFQFLHKAASGALSALFRQGIAIPVVACSVEYLRPVRFGDAPVGYGRLTFGRKAVVTLHYEIVSGRNGPVCARGQTTHCYVDRDFRLLITTPAALREAFEEAAREHPEAFLSEHGAGGQKGTAGAATGDRA